MVSGTGHGSEPCTSFDECSFLADQGTRANNAHRRGNGQRATGNDKERPYALYFDHLKTPYLDRLAAAGVQPEDVDLVLIAYVHVDHVRWNTRLREGLGQAHLPERALSLLPRRPSVFY